MDRVQLRFLESAAKEARGLSAVSEVLTVTPLPPLPPAIYLCEFRVPHLRRADSGRVDVCDGIVVCGIHFPDNYVRSVDPSLPMRVAALIRPRNFVHPNVSRGSICLGYRFAPGTRMRLLLHELYEIVSYQNYTLDESNAMNAEACRLLRAHPELLERLEPPPLVPRRRRARVEKLS